jgi:anti-sigma regulatory factor (Ser/Thr protein kinase)
MSDVATPSLRPSGLEVPSHLSFLPEIRRFVAGAAQRMGFEPQDVGQIEMAVSEACQNIMEHGYKTGSTETVRGRPLRDIILHLTPHPDGLEILILDRAVLNFPVDEKKIVNIQEVFDRGRGLGRHIIHAFMDSVQHRFIEGRGNELRLVKRLQKK